MRQFDLTPYRRSAIGFDRLFDMLETNARQATGDNYPPFNLERIAENHYRITIALAGFSSDEIDITAHQNTLVVAGKKEEKEEDRARFLHIGIANRSFERKFELADFIRVDGANMSDGMLTIDLVREVPEAMKPRKIDVRQGSPEAIEHREPEAAPQAANAA
ncbi:MAG: heat-shock protein [Sphingomonas sp.]|nr:heat-shock protein [Sphingomonas sp.]